jgi:hypothetical protein
MAMTEEHAEIREHAGEHVQFPATREQLVTACNGVEEVPPDERQWFMDNLPEGTYSSSEEVLQALGM